MRGLVGFRAQGMDGRPASPAVPQLHGVINTMLPKQVHSLGVGDYTLPENLWCYIFCWGGGASGNVAGSPQVYTPYGGGGGSAGHSKLLLPKGTLLTWDVGRGATPPYGNGGSSGNIGGDTVFKIDGVIHGTAQGGRAASGTLAARSTATGFQICRYGGGTNEKGEGGQTNYFTGTSRGGGAGGFIDIYGGLTGDGNDLTSTSGGGVPPVPGIGVGGGAATDGSAAIGGGHGQVLILMFRA